MPVTGLRRAAALAFVGDLEVPVLDADDHHHLERVLRLRPGQLVAAADGHGRWRRCRWLVSGGLDPDGPVVAEPAPEPAITVAFAITKAGKPEWIVQKLTEAGVDRLVPLVAARSVVRWDPATAGRHVGRWRKVAREAAMQSRRPRLPVIAEMAGFAEVAAALDPGGAALAEPGGGPPALARPAVLVGPEGGWSSEELACGLPTVGLGSGVLRAETAALAAGVLLAALRAGLVAESGA